MASPLLTKSPPIEIERSMTPTVLAFDPGGTTGWCVMSVHPVALEDDDYPILQNIIYWHQGEIFDSNEVRQATAIGELFEVWDSAALLFEGFKLHNLAAELSPVRITAMSTLIAQTQFLPARCIFEQMGSLAMSTVTDERLKRWGLYKPGQEHARDAERHAITFLRRAKQSHALRKAAWPYVYDAAAIGNV